MGIADERREHPLLPRADIEMLLKRSGCDPAVTEVSWYRADKRSFWNLLEVCFLGCMRSCLICYSTTRGRVLGTQLASRRCLTCRIQAWRCFPCPWSQLTNVPVFFCDVCLVPFTNKVKCCAQEQREHS